MRQTLFVQLYGTLKQLFLPPRLMGWVGRQRGGDPGRAQPGQHAQRAVLQPPRERDGRAGLRAPSAADPRDGEFF